MLKFEVCFHVGFHSVRVTFSNPVAPTLGGVAAAGEAGVHRLAFELFGARAVAVEAPPSVLLFFNTYFFCGVSPGTP